MPIINYPDPVTGEFKPADAGAINDGVNKYTPSDIKDITTQLTQIATNVKLFGAKGDGLSDDTASIQSAIDFVVSKGGGRVYLPAGIYRTTNRIELDSNIEFVGAGMYLTTFFPDYLGANGFPDLIRINGDAQNRKHNVVVRDFGIDGSNLEFYVENEGEPAFEAGQWARITPRFVDNFVAHDIFCYHGSHVFQMSACYDFIIDRIRCDYNFNVVHLTNGSGDNKRGVISNIVATRVACAVDWGGGGSDIVVSDIYANNEGYIRNDQEAIDVGGGKNVQITNVFAENFNFGVTVKGEDTDWQEVRFSNCTFKNFKQYGIRATQGTEAVSGRLSLSNCKFISDKMTASSNFYGIEFIGDYNQSTLDLSNVMIDVNAGGIRAYGFKDFEADKVEVKSGERGIFLEAPGGLMNGSWNLNNIKVNSIGAPIDLRNNNSKAILSNFAVEGDSNNTVAILIRGVSKPILRNGLIDKVGNHGLQIYFESFNIHQPGTFNGLLADLSNIIIRDWGQSLTNRQGLMFIVPSVTGDFKGLRLKDMTFEITDVQNNQIGIAWGVFATNKLDYSLIDGVTFYRVPAPQSVTSGKGTNNLERILTVS